MGDDILQQISQLFEASQKANGQQTKFQQQQLSQSKELTLAEIKQRQQAAELTAQTQIALQQAQAAAAAEQQRRQNEAEAQRQAASLANQNALQQSQIAASAASQTSAQAQQNAQQTAELNTRINMQSAAAAAERDRLNAQTAAQQDMQRLQITADADKQAAELTNRTQISTSEQQAAMARLEKELGVRSVEIANNLKIAEDQLGFNRDQLAANVKIEADKLAQAHEEMVKIGIPKMEADRWYQQQQVLLAQSAQKIDQQRANTEEGKLGFDVYSKAVEMASDPRARYQLGDMLTGVANNPFARNWMAMASGAAQDTGFGIPGDAGNGAITPQQALGDFMSMMGAPSGTSPQQAAGTLASGQDPAAAAQLQAVKGPMQQEESGQGPAVAVDQQSLKGPMQQAAGGPAGLSPQLQAYLQRQQQELGQIGQVADAGAGALAPGTMESWGDDKVKEFQSGLAKLGRDVPTWMSNYAKTRVYQGGPEQMAA